MSARSASTTGLRPTTSSEVDLAPRPEWRRDCAETVRLACALAIRFLLWPLRASAGGVGPLPSRALRRWPPLPTVAPFLLDVRRFLRWLLPAMGLSHFFVKHVVKLVVKHVFGRAQRRRSASAP